MTFSFTVLSALGQMSLQGAVLIAVLLLLRRLFRQRMSPAALYALWLLPAARLLVPGSVGSAFSFLNFLPAPEHGPPAHLGGPAYSGTVPTPSVAPPSGAVYPTDVPLPDAAASGALSPALDGGALLLAVWLLGAAVVLALALRQNLAFLRRAKKDAVAVEADCPLPVYLSEGVSAPCLCGVFRPVILVSDSTLENETHFQMALRHELTHYRAGDHYWALLRLACCAVHWFNPLVWLAARASVQDCESACDHRALRGADQETREAYGLLLLSYLRQPPARYSLLCASSPMDGGKKSLRRRVALIARRPETKKTAAAALAGCVLLTCLVACTGQADKGVLSPQAADALRQTSYPVSVSGGTDDLVNISGGTLANYLEGRSWKKTEPLETDAARDLIQYQVRGESGSVVFSLAMFQTAEDGAYYASVCDQTGTQAKTVYYEVPDRDAAVAYALRHLNGPAAFHAPYEGGEIAMVCTRPSTEEQYHYLFRSDDGGGSYIYIESDLDEQYPHIAQQLYFADEKLGFAGFACETEEGLQPPHLYRTENGGKTWTRVTLPEMDVTLKNGCKDIYVSDIAFTDGQHGCVTVSYEFGGNHCTYSCFTKDGGRTWGGVTSFGPMRTYDPEDPKSAYLVQQDISLDVGGTYQLNVRGVTPEITWTSSDETIAQVDGTGCVTGAAPGTATVTASWDGTAYSCTVRVAHDDGGHADKVLADLVLSVVYEEKPHRLSLAVPAECDVSALTLRLIGQPAAEGGVSAPPHDLMENAELAAGRTYKLDFADAAYTELQLEATYQTRSLSLDLTPLLRSEALAAARVYPLAQASDAAFQVTGRTIAAQMEAHSGSGFVLMGMDGDDVLESVHFDKGGGIYDAVRDVLKRSRFRTVPVSGDDMPDGHAFSDRSILIVENFEVIDEETDGGSELFLFQWSEDLCAVSWDGTLYYLLCDTPGRLDDLDAVYQNALEA